MRPQSAKAKGRRLQQKARDMFLEACKDLEPDDIRSNPMGAHGEDLLFSPRARQTYPFSVECKNVEKLNMWAAIEQAEEYGKYDPMVVFSKNGKDVMVALPLEKLLEIINDTK